MPGSWLFQYSFRNGGSVASFWVTSYWSGVSFFRSSSSEGWAGFIVPPLESFARGAGCDCDCAQPARKRIRAKTGNFRGFKARPPCASQNEFECRVIRCRSRAMVSRSWFPGAGFLELVSWSGGLQAADILIRWPEGHRSNCTFGGLKATAPAPELSSSATFAPQTPPIVSGYETDAPFAPDCGRGCRTDHRSSPHHPGRPPAQSPPRTRFRRPCPQRLCPERLSPSLVAQRPPDRASPGRDRVDESRRRQSARPEALRSEGCGSDPV